MKEINLRDFYPEIYHNDCFINLPDEIVDVLEEYRRKEIAYHRRTYRHKAQYSLEYGNNIEREAVLLTPTLQEIVERHMEEERMYQAIFTLPTKQCQSMRLLTAVSLVRVQQGEFFHIRLLGQAVKTSPFHGGNTGSIPVGVIKL